MIAALYNRMRRFRFDWKLTLLTVLLLPLLMSLGFWQLRREAEKLALQAAWNGRQVEAPVALATVDVAKDQQYRQVWVRGQYDNAHVFLLDNRTYEGRAGYEVIVPLVADDGMVALINRGWQPLGESRAILPAIAAISGDVMIAASVYQPVGDALVLGSELETQGWPKVIQTLDPPQLAALAGYSDSRSVFPYSLRLAEGQQGALIRQWPVISTTPEKHRGYAVQWFLMATALVALYLHYSTRDEAGAAGETQATDLSTDDVNKDRP